MKTMLMSVILFVAFSLFFGVAFYVNKGAAETGYHAANLAMPSFEFTGEGSGAEIKEKIAAFGAVSGIILGLLYFFISVIIILIAKPEKIITAQIALFLSYGWSLIFGAELVFLENRFSAWGNAIIYYLGYPLFYTAILTTILIISLPFVKAFKKQ